MKRQLGYLTRFLGGVLALSSCGTSEPPSVLPYDGSYATANILVTVMMPDEDFFEYDIQCVETEATINGTKDLNAADACTSLSTFAVSERLIQGRSTSGLCSSRNPEDGQLQILGYIDEEFVNTFINRLDGCGQLEWDELFKYIALPPSAAVEG